MTTHSAVLTRTRTEASRRYSCFYLYLYSYLYLFIWNLPLQSFTCLKSLINQRNVTVLFFYFKITLWPIFYSPIYSTVLTLPFDPHIFSLQSFKLHSTLLYSILLSPIIFPCDLSISRSLSSFRIYSHSLHIFFFSYPLIRSPRPLKNSLYHYPLFSSYP